MMYPNILSFVSSGVARFCKTIACIIFLFSLNSYLLNYAYAGGHNIEACLILKTSENPFFNKIESSAQIAADRLDVGLTTYSGNSNINEEFQVNTIKKCIESGVNGILITPTGSDLLEDVVMKSREKGLIVIALDTPFEPTEIADATFATDNFKAGELIGKWAKAIMDKKPISPKIATLDLASNKISIDYLRNNGFLSGFGIDIKDPTMIGDELDPRLLDRGISEGTFEGGQAAMKNVLERNPDINLVYTVNEPAALGAYEELAKANKARNTIIVSIDGGCKGVQAVADGKIGATSMQFPQRMALRGIEAIKAWADLGIKPKNTQNLDFYDTGVLLITDQEVDGISSISSAVASRLCWG